MAAKPRARAVEDKQRSVKAQPRREDIVRAAAQLFYERGFAATTTQDIAERVGMLKGSLYYYIDSKEAVLIEIIGRVHRMFTDNLDMIEKLEGSVLDRFWAYVYRLALANTIHYIESAVFFNEFRALGPGDQQEIIRMRDANDQLVRQLLVEGQELGVVRDDLDPKLTSIAVLTTCNAINRWYQPGGEWSPEFIGRSYANLAVSQVARHQGDAVGPLVDEAVTMERLHSLSLQQSNGRLEDRTALGN